MQEGSTLEEYYEFGEFDIGKRYKGKNTGDVK
jgi:hypothetical protein